MNWTDTGEIPNYAKVFSETLVLALPSDPTNNLDVVRPIISNEFSFFKWLFFHDCNQDQVPFLIVKMDNICKLLSRITTE